MSTKGLLHATCIACCYLLPSAVAFASPAVSAPAAVEASAAFSPLAAHYRESRLNGGKVFQADDWFLLRRAGQVVTARGEQAELWQRDERGEIGLTRVFHADRRSIEYSGGELRTQQRYPDWSGLNGVIEPRRLAAMKVVGKVSFLGRPATRYRQVRDGVTTEVVWLEREALAAKVEHRSGRLTQRLALVSLHDRPLPGWPFARLDAVDDYGRIDGADLGDMEGDPFVQRVMGAAAHGHEHRHR